MPQTLKIRDLPREEKPREKMRMYGPRMLTLAELLAIVLRVGRKGENVVQLCQRVMGAGVDELAKKSIWDLRRMRGIGEVKAMQIAAMLEFGRRLSEHKAKPKEKSTSPEHIAQFYIQRFKGLKKEQFVAVFLDTRNAIIGEKVISVGTLDCALIHPRELFWEAVRENAAGIVLLHNHPSGNPEPSKQDINVTKTLLAASKVMGIELIDHFVIGAESYCSVLDIINKNHQ